MNQHLSKRKTMKRLILLCPIFLILLTPVISQNFKIEWQNCYGGSLGDHAWDMIQTNGGYLVVGYTKSDDGDVSFNHGESDIWLIKIDNSGSLLWEKTFGGSADDAPLRILGTTGGSYYIVGGSWSSDGDISNDPYLDSGDYWIIKIDSIGGIIWNRIIGGPGYDVPTNATTSTDGGIVCFGIAKALGGNVSNYFGHEDMWMIKLNSNGDIVWDFTIGTSFIDIGNAILQTSDGGYLVGGGSIIKQGGNLTCEPFNYNAEAILMKLDSNRNIEWQQCYGGSGHDGILGLLETGVGYVFLAYTSLGDGDLTGSGWHGGNDIWIVKTDYTGNIIWQKCFGGSSDDFANRILPTEDGGFVIVGEVQSLDGDVVGNHSINDNTDIWMFKINSDGKLLWQQCIGGTSDERLDFGVVKKSDYQYVLAGSVNFASLDVTCAPNVVYQDYWVLQVTDTIMAIKEHSPGLDALKVYPNPATDYVFFERQGTQLNPQKQDNILINNILGQVVDSFKMRGKQTIWNTKGIKPGIYSFKIEGSNYSGKVVIRKD